MTRACVEGGASWTRTVPAAHARTSARSIPLPGLSNSPPPTSPPNSQTRTARHKIAKFLRQHAALAASQGMAPPPSSSLCAPKAPADGDARQVRGEGEGRAA